MLRIEVDGDDLVATLELAGEPPAGVSVGPVPFYLLDIDSDGDGSFDRQMRAFPDPDRWVGDVTDLSRLFIEVEEPVISGNSVSMRAPLSLLGPVEKMNVVAYMQGMRVHDLIEEDWMEWLDRVPDEPGRWLSLGQQASPSTRASASAEPEAGAPWKGLALLGIDPALIESTAEGDFWEVREEVNAVQREFRRYLKERPLARYVVDEAGPLDVALELLTPDLSLPGIWETTYMMCKEELKDPAKSRVGEPVFVEGVTAEAAYEASFCVRAYRDLFRAYDLTGDDEVHAILLRFVRSTAGAFERDPRGSTCWPSPPSRNS